MIPLSKAVMRMSTYDRTNQELKWYEEPFYLCTTGGYTLEEIKAECRRRKIDCEHFYVNEQSKDKRKVLSRGVVNDDQKYDKYAVFEYQYHVLKIKLRTWKTTALERKQLADWAITTFNYGEPVFPDDLISYGVWIQPVSEVIMVEPTTCIAGYVDDRETHWV